MMEAWGGGRKEAGCERGDVSACTRWRPLRAHLRVGDGLHRKTADYILSEELKGRPDYTVRQLAQGGHAAATTFSATSVLVPQCAHRAPLKKCVASIVAPRTHRAPLLEEKIT